MGISIVGVKLTRRIARETQQDVVRAWGNGGYTFGFVTDHHEHGWWNKTTGEWGWWPEAVLMHATSCHTAPYNEVFTGDPRPIEERDQPSQPRACWVCGCTDDRACLPPAGPCHWVEQDLCSACQGTPGNWPADVADRGDDLFEGRG